MAEKRRLLIIADPRTGSCPFSRMDLGGTTLVFDENGRFLSRAQAALQSMRREADWLCAAGGGAAAYIALALAAFLPVERLALWSEDAPRCGLDREMKRLRAFAWRNLPLVVSEILLIDGDDALARRFARSMNPHARLRCISSAELQPTEILGEWTDER